MQNSSKTSIGAVCLMPVLVLLRRRQHRKSLIQHRHLTLRMAILPARLECQQNSPTRSTSQRSAALSTTGAIRRAGVFTSGSAQAASTCWSVPIGKERNQPSFLASCGCRPMCPGLPVAALRHTPPNRSPNHSGAAKRGECDVAPVHLMDPETGEYNRPFLTDELEGGICHGRTRRTLPAKQR